MNKIARVAWREFLATVGTKGFIFGILLTPALIVLMMLFMPVLVNQEPPKIDGELAVIDPTQKVTEGTEAYLAAEKIAERQKEIDEKIDRVMPDFLKRLMELVRRLWGDDPMEQAMEQALGSIPVIEVTPLPVDADVKYEKEALLVGTAESGGRLALAVIHGDTVIPEQDEMGYGHYDLYVREKLDDRIEDEIRGALRHGILEARIAARGFDGEDIRALSTVTRSRSVTVALEGERDTNQVLNMMMPMAFILLLFISTFTSGQYLLTTTIEEKSSRVVEVLLSAVSPMELMTGKVVGQMCVGFCILALYGSLGIGGLVVFSLLGLVDPWLFLYLIIFFVIAYFIIGAFMAAIGAAVNELREAQTLMTPIVLVVMVPWMLWLPISRDPNSLFATVLSLVPPINSFVMMLRLSSTTPPPLWQVWLSIALGAAAVYGALWAAAKVFRIGLLLHGKPPSFATLVRWIRMA